MKWTSSLNRALASSIVALSITGGLFATPLTDERTIRCEGRPDPFAFDFPKDLHLCDPVDFYVYAAGLIMQASEGGLEFGIQNNNGNLVAGTGGSAATLTGGKVLGMDFGYNGGIRIGLGGYVDHDAWNLDASWTWVNINNTQELLLPSYATLIPLWSLGIDTPLGQYGKQVNASWKGSYHTVDASLGKPYHVSRYFVLNPLIGARFAVIDQKYRVDYQGLPPARLIFHSKNNFVGLGPRAGITGDWILGRGFKIFGSFAASILRGHYAVNETAGTVVKGFNEHFWDTSPVMETTLGLGWGRHFNCDRNYFGFRFAYEIYEWFNMMQVRKIYGLNGDVSGNAFVNEALRTNLTLSGFSLSFQCDF
jgi:hypothetical protein